MKNTQEKLEQRLKKIADLMKERERINTELAKLTGVEDGKTNSVLPSGVSMMEEITNVFAEKESHLKVADVKKELDKKYSVGLPPRNVRATMNYMTKKGVLVKEKSLYSLKSKNTESKAVG